jgi:hypothetical protein
MGTAWDDLNVSACFDKLSMGIFQQVISQLGSPNRPHGELVAARRPALRPQSLTDPALSG